jgi:ATP-dependent DNA ligase
VCVKILGAFRFIEPCIPTVAKIAPEGPLWIHEIEHDGYRLIVRKDDKSGFLRQRAVDPLSRKSGKHMLSVSFSHFDPERNMCPVRLSD